MTNTAEKKGIWLRDKSLIYSLMHNGFRKGQECYRNRIAMNVVFDGSVPSEEQEYFLRKLHLLLAESMPVEEE